MSLDEAAGQWPAGRSTSGLGPQGTGVRLEVPLLGMKGEEPLGQGSRRPFDQRQLRLAH